MASHRLKLDSSTGDKTLAGGRYVLHATSQVEGQRILRGGLGYIEGRPIGSMNLFQTLASCMMSDGGLGLVIVLEVPSRLKLEASVFTSAFIDRDTKQVGGALRRYAGAREQLALYLSDDVEGARKRIQAEVTGGFELLQHPQFLLEPHYVHGSFGPTSSLVSLIGGLDVAVKAFEAVDFDQYAALLHEAFQPNPLNQTKLGVDVMRRLIIATAESIVMAHLRVMRLQGLQLMGYGFSENGQPVEVVKVQDISQQRHKIDEAERRIASSALFGGELAWLKEYAAHALELMRVESDGW